MHFILGHKLGKYSVHAQLLRHGIRYVTSIAREHDGTLDADMVQVHDGLRRVVFRRVGNHNVSEVVAIFCHVNAGAHNFTAFDIDPEFLHEGCVSSCDFFFFKSGDNAHTSDFSKIAHQIRVRTCGISLPKGLSGGVIGKDFRMRAYTQYSSARIAFAWVNCYNTKTSAGESTCFVESNGIYLAQTFEVI